MMRLLLAGLCVLGIALGLVVATESLLPGPGADGGDDGGIRAAPRLPRLDARKAAAQAEDHTDPWVATILARPLFTRDRKPAAEKATASAAQPGDGGLPRLTGIAVSPRGRSAIFAGAEGGKPVVVGEGGTVGAYTIHSIAPGAVTVDGPDGERTLAPSFDPAPRRLDVDLGTGAPVQNPGQIPGQVPENVIRPPLGAFQPNFPQTGGQQPGGVPQPRQFAPTFGRPPRGGDGARNLDKPAATSPSILA